MSKYIYCIFIVYLGSKYIYIVYLVYLASIYIVYLGSKSSSKHIKHSITNQNEPTPSIIHKKKPLRINIKLTATNNLTWPPKMTSKMVRSAWARVLSLPTWPRSKKTSEKTWTSSLEDFFFKKQSAVFNQTCLYIYIYIYIYACRFVFVNKIICLLMTPYLCYVNLCFQIVLPPIHTYIHRWMDIYIYIYIYIYACRFVFGHKIIYLLMTSDL